MTGLWFKRACALSSDNDMKAAMLTHGALAIPVFEELVAICKESRGAGRITVTYALVAHNLMLKEPQVRGIVGALDREGLLAIDREESDVKVLVADFASWQKWNPKDPTAAERQSRKRHGSERDRTVTVTAPEEEEEKREPPVAPQGGRARDRAKYEQEIGEYAAYLLPNAPEPHRTQLVTSALSWMQTRVDGDLADHHVLMYVRQHAPEFLEEPAA